MSLQASSMSVYVLASDRQMAVVLLNEETCEIIFKIVICIQFFHDISGSAENNLILKNILLRIYKSAVFSPNLNISVSCSISGIPKAS